MVYTSAAYRAWLEMSVLAFWDNGPLTPLPPKVPFWVHILVNINRRKDLDNHSTKQCLDLLQRARAVKDDRYCDRISVDRTADIPKDTLVLRWGVS